MMHRFAGVLVLLVASACSARSRPATRAEWRPSRTSQVPDGTRVRYGTPEHRVAAQGRAVGWQRGVPRIILASGDTVRPPNGAVLHVFVGRTATHAFFGGLMGYLIGVGVVMGTCEGNYCGEQDPTPVLGLLLGALAGHAVKRDRWVTVIADTVVSSSLPEGHAQLPLPDAGLGAPLQEPARAITTRRFTARVDGTRVVASQGVDEDRLELSVQIWGTLRDESHFVTRFVQLDADPEQEFVVVSRQGGSGPYYRLQIIASRPDGILTWSYPSCGQPRFDPPHIGLGACPGEAGAAATSAPELSWYQLTSDGLVPLKR